ncbi:hypothetical protein AI20_02455 [Aeromonas hydrophila YL17]|nr:hypothetical protein AI20_02455 [Aeromonas hydrophila YL17]
MGQNCLQLVQTRPDTGRGGCGGLAHLRQQSRSFGVMSGKVARQGFIRPHLGGILQRRWQRIKRRSHQGMLYYRQGQPRPLTQAQYQQHLQRPVVPTADDRLLSMKTRILEPAVSVQMACLGQQVSHRSHIFTIPQGQQRQIKRLLSQIDAQWQGPPPQKAAC